MANSVLTHFWKEKIGCFLFLMRNFLNFDMRLMPLGNGICDAANHFSCSAHCNKTGTIYRSFFERGKYSVRVLS